MPRARTASGCRRELMAVLLEAARLRLDESIGFAVAVGPGLVHGLAGRHRDDAGARARARRLVDAGLDLRGAAPGTPATGTDRDRRSRSGLTRIAAKCSRRSTRPTAGPCSRPPPRLRPSATLDAWAGDRSRPSRACASSATAPSATATSSSSVLARQAASMLRRSRPTLAGRDRPDRGGRSPIAPSARTRSCRSTSAVPTSSSPATAAMRRPAADCASSACAIAGADADIDAIVALESESFTNPWSRETLVWELANSDVTPVYLLRTTEDRASPSASAG